MCLIAFGLNVHPERPLVVASNRDEAWNRGALPLHTWSLPSGKKVHAGRDQLAGGSWLGFSEDGRVAMLTNVRKGRPEPGPRSRGDLVTSWLDHDGGWEGWLDQFDTSEFGGFNLVLGNVRSSQWAWFTNQSISDTTLDCPPGWMGSLLGPGVYGLSNGALDTPWPKTVALRRSLAEQLSQGFGPQAESKLLDTLLQMGFAPDSSLPKTGIPFEMERELSSIFVHVPQMGYGTRCSLLASCDASGHLELQEWSHNSRLLAAASPRPARWPLQWSDHKRISISMWGMPTSS